MLNNQDWDKIAYLRGKLNGKSHEQIMDGIPEYRKEEFIKNINSKIYNDDKEIYKRMEGID